MFEAGTGSGVDVRVQITLAVAGDAIAQDQVVHPAADIERVDLHVAEVGEGRRHVGPRRVEQERPTEKSAGGQAGDLERRERHEWRNRGDFPPLLRRWQVLRRPVQARGVRIAAENWARSSAGMSETARKFNPEALQPST